MGACVLTGVDSRPPDCETPNYTPHAKTFWRQGLRPARPGLRPACTDSAPEGEEGGHFFAVVVQVLDAQVVGANALEALADQLAFQQALIDTIPYPIFYKDTQARFLGFNRAYEETFAIRREDLIGKQVVAVVNFPPKQIGPFLSECLVLGAYTETGEVVLLQTERGVDNGLRIG